MHAFKTRVCVRVDHVFPHVGRKYAELNLRTNTSQNICIPCRNGSHRSPPTVTVIEKLIPSFFWCWRFLQDRIPSRWTWLKIYVILPQISSKGANFLSAICSLILTLKILSYDNNSGDITKRLFFDDQPIRNLKRPWSIQPPNWKPCRWLIKSSLRSDVTIVEHLPGFFELI